MLIKTEQKLLLHGRVVLALGGDTLEVFMRIHEDYGWKDLRVLGASQRYVQHTCMQSMQQHGDSFPLWTEIDRLYFGIRAPETELVITSDNNKILHYSTPDRQELS